MGLLMITLRSSLYPTEFVEEVKFVSAPMEYVEEYEVEYVERYHAEQFQEEAYGLEGAQNTGGVAAVTGVGVGVGAAANEAINGEGGNSANENPVNDDATKFDDGSWLDIPPIAPEQNTGGVAVAVVTGVGVGAASNEAINGEGGSSANENPVNENPVNEDATMFDDGSWPDIPPIAPEQNTGGVAAAVVTGVGVGAAANEAFNGEGGSSANENPVNEDATKFDDGSWLDIPPIAPEQNTGGVAAVTGMGVGPAANEAINGEGGSSANENPVNEDATKFDYGSWPDIPQITPEQNTGGVAVAVVTGVGVGAATNEAINGEGGSSANENPVNENPVNEDATKFDDGSWLDIPPIAPEQNTGGVAVVTGVGVGVGAAANEAINGEGGSSANENPVNENPVNEDATKFDDGRWPDIPPIAPEPPTARDD
jgi:hypothetical protein